MWFRFMQNINIMKANLTFSLLLFAVLLNSCSVTTMLRSSEKSMSRQAESNGNSVVLVNKPIVADLTVAMARQTVICNTTNLELSNSTMDIQAGSKSAIMQGGEWAHLKTEAKKRAQFQFMKDFECDYLVDPIYTVDVQSQSNSEVVNFQVELSAFPAKYSKFTQPDSLPKSVMQISAVDNRSLPLYVATKTSEKIAPSREVGGFAGVGLSKQIDPLSTDEAIVSWNFGLYKSFGASKPVGFRGELKVVGFGGKGIESYTDYSNWPYTTNNYEVKKNYTSIAVPLMLSVNLKKVNILAGLIPSYNISTKYETNHPDYNWASTSSQGMDNGLTFGLYYKITDKFSAGYRFEKFQNLEYTNHGLSFAVRFK